MDFFCDFHHMQLPEGLIDSIRECGKKSGASVNDQFLAAAMQTLGNYTAEDRKKACRRFLRPKRDRVGLSVAVDIRPFANESLNDRFGFFLSYFNVLLENPEAVPLSELAARIAAITKLMKTSRHPLRFFQSFKMVNLFWDYYRQPRQRALMLHRAAPLLGGISNVNLTDSWIGRDGRVLDYLRVSPTGPLLPIVFALTTIGKRLSLCVTHRNAAFSAEQGAEIRADFVRRLCNIN